MTAQIHVDFKELVRLKKDTVIAMGMSENYSIPS